MRHRTLPDDHARLSDGLRHGVGRGGAPGAVMAIHPQKDAGAGQLAINKNEYSQAECLEGRL